MTEIDVHIETSPLTGVANECGDLGFVRTGPDTCFLALVDALGHGETAHAIALAAAECLETHHDREPAEVISRLHDHLRGTRGAVAAVCRLDIGSGTMAYSGMGNISLKIIGSRPERLVTRDGVLGYMIPTPRQGEARLYPGDLLVMSSDGIREHFDPDTVPDLFTGTSAEIAAKMIQYLGKQTDDAGCIVLRYGI